LRILTVFQRVTSFFALDLVCALVQIVYKRELNNLMSDLGMGEYYQFADCPQKGKNWRSRPFAQQTLFGELFHKQD